MNKNLLSLGAFIALLGAMPATAKMPTNLNSKPQRLRADATPAEALKFVKAHTAQLLAQQKAGGLKTAKTTAMDSRVIAYAYRESDGTMLSLTDSSKLQYSWGRGGDLKSDVIKFDSSFNYTNGGTSAPLQLDSRNYATYDANNNQLTNYTQVYNYSTSTYDQSARTLNTFNASNLMVTTEAQSWDGTAWNGSYMDKYTYNSAGKQVTDTAFEWNSTSYDYYTLTVTSYTSTGKESNMMLYVYIGTWIPYVSVDYTYNTADNVSGVAVKINMSGTGLEDYERVTYAYDAAKNPITQDIEIWDGATWSNYMRVASTFDASANVLSEVTLYWDGTSAYDSSNRTDYTYNTSNQETSETTYTYDGSSWIMDSGDSRTNYYYEDFSPTAVKEASAVTAHVNLFPVPAGDELSLQIAQTTAQSVDMQIVDMQGRSVINRHYASAKNISDKISVSNLTSGTYFLKLSDGTVRNFTVAH